MNYCIIMNLIYQKYHAIVRQILEQRILLESEDDKHGEHEGETYYKG